MSHIAGPPDPPVSERKCSYNSCNKRGDGHLWKKVVRDASTGELMTVVAVLCDKHAAPATQSGKDDLLGQVV